MPLAQRPSDDPLLLLRLLPPSVVGVRFGKLGLDPVDLRPPGERCERDPVVKACSTTRKPAVSSSRFRPSGLRKWLPAGTSGSCGASWTTTSSPRRPAGRAHAAAPRGWPPSRTSCTARRDTTRRRSSPAGTAGAGTRLRLSAHALSGLVGHEVVVERRQRLTERRAQLAGLLDSQHVGWVEPDVGTLGVVELSDVLTDQTAVVVGWLPPRRQVGRRRPWSRRPSRSRGSGKSRSRGRGRPLAQPARPLGVYRLTAGPEQSWHDKCQPRVSMNSYGCFKQRVFLRPVEPA